MNEIDMDIRERLWNEEGVVVCCEMHREKLHQNPGFISETLTSAVVSCGYLTCNNMATWEVKLAHGVKNA